MSVVAYKHGILAADTRAYGGAYETSPGVKSKIHTLDDGTRVGVVSSELGEPERFVAWLRAGADPAAWKGDKPDVRALLVKPDGLIFLAHESLSFSGPISSDQYAIGSGSKFALGAMEYGATAEEAVRIACKFDPHCGEPVAVLRPVR